MKEKKKACKLELTWPGKDNWEQPEPRLLLEKSRHGTRKGTEENLLIYGDNLLGLKALERNYAGKIKCVYIDPPYNTKSCFKHYDDSMEHSLWLNMMKERLLILKKLLRDDGSIWINIDESECHYLKVMCDEIFGRKNFVIDIAWRSADSSNHNSKQFSLDHNSLLVYSKGNNWKPNFLIRTEQNNVHYKNPDNDPKGPWFSGNLSSPAPRPNLRYEVTSPKGVKIQPPKNGWRWEKDRMKLMIAKGEIIFSNDGTRLIKKTYLKDQGGLTPSSMWDDYNETGHNRQAKYELKKLFPKVQTSNLFATPKPERLLRRILHLATRPGDLVLDCFAGSGTTGAVAHKMKRHWIMIELKDHCHTHIIPRLQNVIDGTDKGGITEAVDWKGGGGFRYCELAPSLLEKNRFNRWTISKKYNPVMLIDAMCLHAGYTFNPRGEPWWLHGQSSEDDFIFVTGSTLARTQLMQLSQELEENQSLLVYCGAFRGNPKEFENLTVKKIPKSILHKCEWGRDDYSLKIALQEEAKLANKRKSKKELIASGETIRVALAAKGGNP